MNDFTMPGHAMPEMIQQFRDLLLQFGFPIQQISETAPQIVAYQKGTWFRSMRQIRVYLSPLTSGLMRVEVAAVISNTRRNPDADGRIASRILSRIRENMKPNKPIRYGIR